VQRHLFALIPGQSASQGRRQLADGRGDAISDRLGGVRLGDVEQDQVARLALDQRADCGAVGFADDQIALPMAGLGAIFDQRRARADGRDLESSDRAA